MVRLNTVPARTNGTGDQSAPATFHRRATAPPAAPANNGTAYAEASSPTPTCSFAIVNAAVTTSNTAANATWAQATHSIPCPAAHHKTGNTIAVKMRVEPTDRMPEQRVHPGHDWFFVVEGRVRLTLGERDIVVETGEVAEFATMTPHAFVAEGGPAELIMIFDRDGQRAHVHHED